MRLKRVSKFTKPLTKGLLKTQQATIGAVVCGMLVSRCLLLAEIARCIESRVAFIHNLKRVFRYGDNPRISQQNSKEAVAARLMGQLRRRLRLKAGQYLEIIIDWTSVGDYQVLSALIPVGGRAVPVLQWAVKKWEFDVSQNHVEQQFLQSLRRCVSRSWRVIIVADRGFGRVQLFRFLPQLGFHYVIRIKGDAWMRVPSYYGPVRQYPLRVGQTFKLRSVRYHQRQQIPLNLALNCAWIKGKVSTWLLATNLPHTARQIVDIYRRRFWCEESFRDQKQEFQLERVRVKAARRLENLLLALALVFLILAVIGLRGENLSYADKFAGRKKKSKMISWIQIALFLLRDSTKFLDLLFDNRSHTFSLYWV